MAIKKDNVVTMQYDLKDVNAGIILESNKDSQPLSFITGKEQIIAKLEEEILKLSIGDSKKIHILAADGCGIYDDNAIQTLPREQFAGIELTQGMHLFGQGEDGKQVQVIVKSFDDSNVEIDFNHPYAGKDLEFDLTIIDVRDATDDEKISGMVAGAQSCGCGDRHDDHAHEHGGEGCCGGNGGGCCGGHSH